MRRQLIVQALRAGAARALPFHDGLLCVARGDAAGLAVGALGGGVSLCAAPGQCRAACPSARARPPATTRTAPPAAKQSARGGAEGQGPLSVRATCSVVGARVRRCARERAATARGVAPRACHTRCPFSLHTVTAMSADPRSTNVTTADGALLLFGCCARGAACKRRQQQQHPRRNLDAKRLSLRARARRGGHGGSCAPPCAA